MSLLADFWWTEPWEWLVFGVKVVLIALAALAGAWLGGMLTRALWGLARRELSRRGLFRSRLAGAVGGGVLAWFLLFMLNVGDGFGLGPGARGRPGTPGPLVQRPSDAASTTTPATAPATPALTAPPATRLAVVPTVLRVKLLGGKTEPPAKWDFHVFALLDDPVPQPVAVETILERVQEMKRAHPNGALLVRLLVTANSTPLVHAEVTRLRKEVRGLGVSFDMPDPKNPIPSPEAGI